MDLLKEIKIQQSMDWKGRAIDNIFIERFWRTIKYEYVYISPSNGGHELYLCIEENVRFCNHEILYDSLEIEIPARKFGQIKTKITSTSY